MADYQEPTEKKTKRHPLETLRQYREGSPNIVEFLSEEQVNKIGNGVISFYEVDKSSMATWLDMLEKARDLASEVRERRPTV